MALEGRLHWSPGFNSSYQPELHFRHIMSIWKRAEINGMMTLFPNNTERLGGIKFCRKYGLPVDQDIEIGFRFWEEKVE